jgi:ABC-2 type transport system ATP-binding protein
MGLIHDPEIVFLDEPTSGLDPEARSAVWDLISELSGQGRTIFMTTHNMEEADHLCHRLAILVKGRVRERGTPAEIKRLLGTDRLELRLEREGLPELQRLCRELSLDCGEEEGVTVLTGDSLPEKLPLIASRLSGSLRDLHYREVTLEDAFLRFMEEVEK